MRSLVSRQEPTQLSLTVKAPPADADPWALRIARSLVDHLDAVGVDATLTPVAPEALLRDVLVNQRFDCYVARFPAWTDPDYLRGLLHSRFAAEPGWQNPFGYADLDVDELLVRQRRESGTARDRTLTAVQEAVVRDQPFSVVACPDDIHAVRADRYRGWERAPVHSPLGYLRLDAVDPLEAGPLRVTLADARPTENLNPLAAEFRADGTVTGLLYDSIGRWMGSRVRPWLAESWTWSLPPTADGPVATVRLREGLAWHDGTRLTASDAAFTYRFLADTSLDRLDSPVPAPRFRGRESLVAEATALDDRTLRLAFVPSSRAVAARALTVPVLPEHVWRTKADQATVAGVDTGGAVTKALVWSNPDPVGSGPLRVARRRPAESLLLERNADHFLDDDPSATHFEEVAGGFDGPGLAFTVVPSSGAAVELVGAGEADATASSVTPTDVPRIGRSDAVDLLVDQPRSFYHVGYNLRRGALSSPRFRRGVARLLDKRHLVRDVFGGYAVPAVSPLSRHDALAPEFVWTGDDPTFPFPGSAGRLDADRARELFREAGYRYDDGALVVP